MSITGPGSITASNVAAQTTMMDQLNTLGQELASGQAAQTYSGLQSQAGVALALNAQISAINGYSNTASTIGTTLSIAQSALTALDSTSSAVQKSINDPPAFSLNASGQTQTQVTAASQLDQILSLLNTQVGNNYIFSGSAVNQPSVASTSDILNGNGAQAGFKQILSERQQADLGSGTGRLSTSTAGTTVTLSQDGSPFGFQLTGVNSSLTGATVTGPSPSPATTSVNLGATGPNAGDTIQFQLTLPDGSTQTIALQATSSATPGTNQFSIGATSAVTATNLQTALNTAITGLTQTALPAASAMAAAKNFFETSPPQIVNPGSPANYTTAMSLMNGTSADTVMWYTGENGATPARQTQTALVAPGTTVDYGMRANEQAFSNLVANVAVLASTTYSASNPNAQTSYQALTQKVAANLDPTSGLQTVADVEADLANVQTTVSNASTVNSQTQKTLTDLVQNIDGVDQNKVGEQILTLQNNLSASMSITARLAQISLVNFLAPSAG